VKHFQWVSSVTSNPGTRKSPEITQGRDSLAILSLSIISAKNIIPFNFTKVIDLISSIKPSKIIFMHHMKQNIIFPETEIHPIVLDIK